jgi:hypothetical protein
VPASLTRIIRETTPRTHEIPPDPVHSPLAQRPDGVHHVPSRFGHLGPGHRPVRVGEDGAGRFESRGHEQCRPVDGVESAKESNQVSGVEDEIHAHEVSNLLDNVLADDMCVRRPSLERFRVSQHGDIVDQSVDPDVYHLFGIPGDWDAPPHP